MKKLIFLLLLMTVSLYAEVVEKVVATVNGEPVTLSELERILQPVYKQFEQVYTGEELEFAKKRARQELLGQLIENKLVLQKAKEEGVQITEAGMEEELADIKEKFGSIEEFEKALENEGLTLEEYKKELTEQLTIRAMIEKEVVPKAKVGPDEVKEYYRTHKEEFTKPAKVHIGHILIKDDERKIQDIYNRLNKGEDFNELSSIYSEAGDLGVISIDQLKPELREIVDSLKVGEYSRIIKTDIGWHIIKLIDREDAQEIPLSDVWDKIEDKLFRKKLSQEHKKWITRLKSKAHIVVME